MLFLAGCASYPQPTAPQTVDLQGETIEFFAPQEVPWGAAANPIGLYGSQPGAASTESECFKQSYEKTKKRYDEGKLPLSGPFPPGNQMACVMAAICDTIDDVPNYFAFAEITSRGTPQAAQNREFFEECKAVGTFGPEIIRQQPALFEESARFARQIP